MDDAAGMVIGHAPMGVVEEVGSSAVSIQRSDRVTVLTHICRGFCFNCLRCCGDAHLATHPGR
ncbi:MAG TPA: alcohol dehydrogenase catalytic domain-containing protein [Usitatibacter sp.]